MSTKVQTIIVSNLKAVSSLSIDFNGSTAIITGKNNGGKTSFLRSLIDRVRGIKDLVLRHNEKEGYAETVLTSGEKFMWTFDKEGKEKLTFVTDKNIKVAVTREIANRYFPKGFDIDKFLNDTPGDQNKTLQRLVGLDFDEINIKYKAAYDKRTLANGILSQEESGRDIIDKQLPTEVMSTEDLEKELFSIDVHNLKWDNRNTMMLMRKNQSGANAKLINDYKQKILDLEKKNKTLAAEVKADDQWLTDTANIQKTNQEQLTEQIADMEEKNMAIVANNKIIAQEAKITELRKKAKDADDAVKTIDDTRKNMIKEAKMPEGFGFNSLDGGITFNGFEFNKNQLSSSSIYIGALKLAAKTLGEVKTLYFDASHLDKVELGKIEKWAAKEGLQLLIERPDWDAGEIQYELINNPT